MLAPRTAQRLSRTIAASVLSSRGRACHGTGGRLRRIGHAARLTGAQVAQHGGGAREQLRQYQVLGLADLEPGAQAREHLGREAPIGDDFGAARDVDPRQVHSALEVEAAVREHRADLQDRGQDAPPARRAERQPGAPPCMATTGHMLDSGRLPGAIELGRPGRGSNHMTPLLSRMPVDGDTILLPNGDSRVWVRLTMVPARSTAHR